MDIFFDRAGRGLSGAQANTQPVTEQDGLGLTIRGSLPRDDSKVS